MPVSNMPFNHSRKQIRAGAAGLALWACIAAAHGAPDNHEKYDEIWRHATLYQSDQGLQYTTMDDAASDGGEYDGWGLTTGLRLYWQA